MLSTLTNREIFIEKLKKDITKQFPNLNYQLWVFGSFLTNEYTAGKSDIDIGIYCDDTTEVFKIYSYLDTYFKNINLKHDIVIMELDNDTSYMNIPIMLYGHSLTDYYKDEFITSLKRLISVWGMNPFETLLKRSRVS